MTRRLTASLLVGLLLACGRTPSETGRPLAFYLDSLRAALPAWQLPDSTDPDSLSRFRSGDADNDGHIDRALLLTRGDSGVLLFFRGTGNGTFSPPQVLGAAPDLGSDILVFDGNTVVLGPWASDNTFAWQWDATSASMKYDDSRPAEE